MPTLTITSKGQVTLRKDVLRHMGVKPGDKVEVSLLPKGRLSLQPAGKTSIDEFIGGIVSPLDRTPTLDEIKSSIEEGWAGIR